MQNSQTKNVTKFYNSFKSASLSNKKVTHTYFATRTGIKTKKGSKILMKTTIFMQWALCTSKYCLLRKPFGALFKKTDRNRKIQARR